MQVVHGNVAVTYQFISQYGQLFYLFIQVCSVASYRPSIVDSPIACRNVCPEDVVECPALPATDCEVTRPFCSCCDQCASKVGGACGHRK